MGLFFVYPFVLLVTAKDAHLDGSVQAMPNLACHDMGCTSAEIMVKAHRILGKSEIMQMDYLNFSLEAVASSARFGILTEQQASGNHVTRANMHLLLVAPFAFGKTSGLINLREHAVMSNRQTFSGLIGTINREGEFNSGAAVEAARRVLFVDEFQRMTDDVKDCMNSLLEYPHCFDRNLGFHVKKSYHLNKPKGFCKVDVVKGKISVYSKFSCIAGGMYLCKDSPIEKAWASRSINVVLRPSLEYYERLSRGEAKLKVNPSVFESNFLFKREDFAEFNRAYWASLKAYKPIYDYFQKHSYDRGYSIRMMQDLARMSCFIASLDKRCVIRKEDWQSALKFQKMLAVNTIFSGLTEIEQEILEHPDEENKAISAKIHVSDVGVWKARKRLYSMGLLEGGESHDSGLQLQEIN